MNLPESITSSFSVAAKTLIDMREEITKLEAKFGQGSTLVQTKLAQLDALILFYEHMRDIVPKMMHGLHLATANHEALMVLEIKRNMALSWDQAKEALGIPPEKIKSLKSVDEVLARLAITAQ